MDEGAQDIRQALQAIQLFSDVLTSEQLDFLARRSIPCSFPPGATLIRQGEVGGSVFCITRGTVSVTIADPAQRRTELRRLPPGTVVGELELFSGEPRTASIIAVTDVEALEITKPVIQDLLARSPELAQSFVAIGAIRREMLDQVLGKPGSSLLARALNRVRRTFRP